MHGDAAHYFVNPDFLNAHVFSVLSRDTASTTLAFCPPNGTLPHDSSISGQIRLAPDGRILGASWFFETPAPDENSGGSVEFLPAEDSLCPDIPVPTVGMFFRLVSARQSKFQVRFVFRYTVWMPEYDGQRKYCLRDG